MGDVGLAGAADVEVAAVARSDQRALVTENVADFAAEQDLLVVCVLKRNQLSGAGQARAVAVLLDRSPSGRAVDPLRTRIPRRALTDSCSCEPKPSGAREPNPGSSLDHITGWWSPRAASRLDTSDDGRYGGLDWFDHRDNG